MRRLLIGVAIDILKWMNKPLYHLHLAASRLRDKRIDLIVLLQYEYYETRRRDGRLD